MIIALSSPGGCQPLVASLKVFSHLLLEDHLRDVLNPLADPGRQISPANLL